jgi:hypothetical protein
LLLVAVEEVAGDFIHEFPFHEGFRVRGLLFPVVADLAAFEVEEFAQRGTEAVRFPACHAGVPLREGAAVFVGNDLFAGAERSDRFHRPEDGFFFIGFQVFTRPEFVHSHEQGPEGVVHAGSPPGRFPRVRGGDIAGALRQLGEQGRPQ